MRYIFEMYFLNPVKKVVIWCSITGLCVLLVVGCGGTGNSFRDDTPPDFSPYSPGFSGAGTGSHHLNTARTHSSRTHCRKGRLTILLAQYNQSDRVQQGRGLQQRAKRLLRSDDIWLNNDHLGLAVNYGHFQTDAEAHKSLVHVRKIYKNLRPGRWQFAYIKEIPEPDPPAPKEWNLLNSSCDYSLEIATYYDIPKKNYYGRKTDAVKAVDSLRQSGEIAFFVHGHLHSRVYIGCLSAEHIRSVRKDDKMKLALSPQAKLLQKKHPNYHEQGNKLYVIDRRRNGRNRIAVRPKFIEVQSLRTELPF